MNRLQGISVYRKIAKTLQPKVDVHVANENDMQEIYAWFSDDSAQAPTSQDPTTTNIVAKKKNRIIAFVQLVRRPLTTQFYSGYWLFSLKVKPIYRGMGIGSKLSAKVIEMTLHEGVEELFLQVNENNLKAIRLYQRLGFIIKKIPEIESLSEKLVPPNGQKNVIMSKLFQ